MILIIFQAIRNPNNGQCTSEASQLKKIIHYLLADNDYIKNEHILADIDMVADILCIHRFRLNRSCSEFCNFQGIWLWNGAISLLQGQYAWRNLGLSVLLKGTVVMADAY